MAYEEKTTFDWDDAITDDGQDQDWVLLPAGEYDFTVDELEKSYYPGGAKLPPCNCAILTLKIQHPDGTTNKVWDRLYLVKKVEWKLSSFFRSIGVKQHGESVTMDWDAVVGATGRCKVGVHEYNGQKQNDIKAYLDPAENKPAMTPGVF